MDANGTKHLLIFLVLLMVKLNIKVLASKILKNISGKGDNSFLILFQIKVRKVFPNSKKKFKYCKQKLLRQQLIYTKFCALPRVKKIPIFKDKAIHNLTMNFLKSSKLE